LSDSVKPGTGTKPTTDKVVVNDIIGPLAWSQPLEIDMDAMGGRDEERENILLILNTIATRMLPEGWEKHELQRRRATNFFYQGSIAWWMNDILIPSVRYALVKLGDKKPALLDAVDEETKGKIISIVEHLCSWTIWSTEDADDLKAMRSNTKKSVEEAFAAYDDKRLLKESGVI